MDSTGHLNMAKAQQLKLTKEPAPRSSSRRKKPPMWKHQKETVKLLDQQERVLDLSDPGTGKTRAHLEWFAKHNAKYAKAALVIAPKSLLESAWGEDIRNYCDHLEVSVAYAKNRDDAFSEIADVYITNTDAVKWLAQKPASFFKKFDTLIVDELSTFKHRTSQRSKAIRKIAKHFQYRRGLTGTPNSNSITDIWHQALIIDDGERLGTSFFKFRQATQIPEQVGPQANMVRWNDKPGIEAGVAALLGDISIRHEFEKCMDIPPNFKHHVPYYMNGKTRNLYDELARDLVLQLEDGTVDAVNAASLRTKLFQIASGAVYTSEEKYSVLDEGRYELILDLIEEREHSVTFFNWKHQKDKLLEHSEKRGLSYACIDGSTPDGDRKEIVEAYQAGFYRTLFLHPRTGAHGLTLTRGTATIWASPVYEPDLLKQGMHRVFRGGQKKKTETIMVEAHGTVEQQVFQRLYDNNNKMVSFLDMLKESGA